MSDSWQDVNEDSFVQHGTTEEEEQEMNDEQMTEDFKDTSQEFVKGIREVELLGLVDIGALGAWSVSSSKTGSSVKELRDDSPMTYWQSDGIQPHHLDIHFSKRVTVSRLSLFTDYMLDESYTPSKIVVLTGNGFHDLLEVTTLNLHQPSGWTHVEFDKIEGITGGIKTFLIRILVVANHQHGKDTHVRAVKVYSPGAEFSMDTTVLGGFTSAKLLSESTIR